MEFFKVGQTVYSPYLGEGIVEAIDTKSSYPVVVHFISYQKQRYTIDGRYMSNLDVTLFQNPPVFQPNVPIKPMFKKGDLVWVSDNGSYWSVRYYSHFDSKNHYCFTNQLKQDTTTRWTHIRKFDDCPL